MERKGIEDMTGRWIVYNTVFLSILAAGMIDGVVQETLFSDQTGLVWVVVGVACLGSIASRWRPSFSDWLCEQGLCPMLGLLGTVAGFMVAIAGAVEGDISMKFAGVSTALSTTAVGIVAHLYLLVMQRMMQ